MSRFDPFVLPFAIGLYTVLIIFIAKGFDWIKHLPADDRRKLGRGIISLKIFPVLGEIFSESLLHRRIFRKNPLLGYMHMSLAFGWFLLVVIGTIESKIFSRDIVNNPWDPIFLKFFEHHTAQHRYHGIFGFTMDFLLAFVLTGVMLAWIKRISSRLFGIRKPTRQIFFDKIALGTLWVIFPLRLIAESLTAAEYQNGGFLTNNLGGFIDRFLPAAEMEYTFWWLYSFSVGVFFVTLPYSRYMHIPTETILIALRRFGIRTDKAYTTFSQIEVYSCSRCGICIDACPLSAMDGHKQSTSIYWLNTVRGHHVRADRSFDCLLCGRCQEMCPVRINTTGIRQVQRSTFISDGSNYSFLRPSDPGKGKVAYFAGCMTHLTPTIRNAMVYLFGKSGIPWVFIDRDGGACCGRPLMTLGNFQGARELMEHNRRLIRLSNAEILVTSCPICMKIFRDDYNLPIPVLHHTQFILEMVRDGRISLKRNGKNVVYHDPCELGRGCGIYDEPRQLLAAAANLVSSPQEKNHSMCCGGSLGNIMLNQHERDALCRNTLGNLMAGRPDILATSCPLCKKTFSRNSPIPVRDVAEIIAGQLMNDGASSSVKERPSLEKIMQ